MFKALCLLLAVVGFSRTELSDEYENQIRLDDGNETDPTCTMYWTYNNATNNQSTLSFAVRVRTLGWVGFGFANEINEMRGYDVVMGSIDKHTNETSVMDCHTVGQEPPINDIQQNLQNVSIAQEDEYTTLRFTRLVYTKDENDIQIKAGAMIVVWSYSNTDNPRIKHVEKGHKIVRLIPTTDAIHTAPRSGSISCEACQGILYAAVFLFMTSL